MVKIKKILFFISILIISLTLVLIAQTYAKYLTSTSGTASIPVAKWNIVLNNQSIKNNSDISSSIVPVFSGTENIASGIIAPTSTGYFDLALDFSNVDVSCSYSINSTVDDSSLIKDLVITGYSIDDGPVVNLDNYNQPIENTILYTDTERTKNIRVFIMWNDDSESSTMTNQDDTSASSSSADSTNVALFKVSINFKQIAN